jgi:hypothetical protein
VQPAAVAAWLVQLNTIASVRLEPRHGPGMHLGSESKNHVMPFHGTFGNRVIVTKFVVALRTVVVDVVLMVTVAGRDRRELTVDWRLEMVCACPVKEVWVLE